jgi:hypothetical protein
MPAAPLYSSLTPEDIRLSGPHAWPKIAADHAVDRFIFRRPELAYIVAKKRMLERRKKAQLDPHPSLMGVRFRRVYYDGGRRDRKGTQRFGHPINHDDDQADVREFLVNLRRILNRSVPDQPLVNCSVQLRFYDFAAKTDELLSWQEKWL